MSKSKFPRIALVGASGRLGTRIQELHESEFQQKLRLIYRVQRQNLKTMLADLESIDAILDVSAPDAAVKIQNQILAQKLSVPYVVGCTGWSSGQLKSLQNYSKHACVVFAPNFSPGVNLFFSLIEQAAPLFKAWGYSVLVSETHHDQKKDAPSGTAKQMIEKLGNGAKPQVASFRAGTIVGTHEIQFVGPGDVLSLKHEALDRGIFARGALMATIWATDHSRPGFFSMKDVLKV